MADPVSSIASTIMPSVFSTFKFVFIFLIIIGIAAGLLWALITIFRYNTKVIILSERTGALKSFEAKGAYIKDKQGNVLKFKLFFFRKTIAPPDYNYLINLKRGSLLLLYQVSEDDFVPLSLKNIQLENGKDGKITCGSIEFTPIPYDMKLWAQQQMREGLATYGNEEWYVKYMPHMMFVLAMFGCIILIYLILQQFGDLVPAFTQASRTLSEVARNCRGTTPY